MANQASDVSDDGKLQLRVQRGVKEVRPIRIPFDSFTLSVVVTELEQFLGAKLQDVRQPDDHDVALSLYVDGREGIFLLCCHAEYARAHFITKKLANQGRPPQFCATLRSRLYGTRLVRVEQIHSDRVIELSFESPEGDYKLIAELMGKHSNLVLVDSKLRILSAAKWVGASKSSRPIQPNGTYTLPPVMANGVTNRRSPFLARLIEATGSEELGPIRPVISPGHGAYPISVAALGLPEFGRSSISIALEQHFNLAIPEQATEALRSTLIHQLERSILAKDVALSDLRQAIEAGGKAPEWQRNGELLLAYGPSSPEGASEIGVWDYDGKEMCIALDPEIDFKANAARYFDRAKKAKARMGIVSDQLARITTQRIEILSLVERIRSEPRLEGLERLKHEAVDRRWLIVQSVPAASKEDRPYEGHRIRELQAPGGYTVLFGENAESNDFLTLRVAKPNDLWLHVRGDTSAHVVIVTNNHPEKVQPETLRFAAKVAVLNSRAKHAGYVSVDYTLKKYVRRPKGAAKGAAIYTNEKTLSIES